MHLVGWGLLIDMHAALLHAFLRGMAAEMTCVAHVSGMRLPATRQPQMSTHTGCTGCLCRGGVLLTRGGVLSLLAPSGADSYTLGILADPRATRRVRRRSCRQPGHMSSTACQQHWSLLSVVVFPHRCTCVEGRLLLCASWPPGVMAAIAKPTAVVQRMPPLQHDTAQAAKPRASATAIVWWHSMPHEVKRC